MQIQYQIPIKDQFYFKYYIGVKSLTYIIKLFLLFLIMYPIFQYFTDNSFLTLILMYTIMFIVFHYIIRYGIKRMSKDENNHKTYHLELTNEYISITKGDSTKIVSKEVLKYREYKNNIMITLRGSGVFIIPRKALINTDEYNQFIKMLNALQVELV